MRKILSVIVCLILFMVMTVEGVAAATVETITSEDHFVEENTTLDLSRKNCTITWNTTKYKEKTGAGGETLLCIPIKSTSSAWSMSDFLTLTFTNAGRIGGKVIDCKITIDSISVTARKGSSSGETSDKYMGVCSLWDNGSGVHFGVTIDDGCGFRAAKTIKHTITIYYHNTGEIVDLPFFQAIRDMDSHASYYTEAWECGDGYSGTYYKYPNNYCIFTGNKVSAPTSGTNKDYETAGDDSILISGIYATTLGGQFSATFYVGNCRTKLMLYSPYETTSGVFVNPTISVNMDQAKPGDSIEYTVTHTMGIMYEDLVGTYEIFEIIDNLPDALEYQGARVIDGECNDITASGTLTYDPETGQLKFLMGKSWIEDESNYDGKAIKLIISTTLKDFAGETGSISNKAQVTLNSELIVNTNTVTTSLAKAPSVQIIQRIPDRTDQFGDGHGQGTFIFKIEGQESGKCWYRALTMDADSASDQWTLSKAEGYLVATSCRFTLPDDEYVVSEIKVSRYRPLGFTQVKDGNATQYTFTSEKANWRNFSHNSLVISSLRGGD